MKDISIYEVMESSGTTAGNTCCYDFEAHSSDCTGIRFERGFFFLLVINGTARLVDAYDEYDLDSGNLVVLTPSTTSTIEHFDACFALKVVYMVPSYFDSLPDG